MASHAQDQTPWGLPEGTFASLGGTVGGSDRAVAYSHDGTRLAVANSLRITTYDAQTYNKGAGFSIDTGAVNSVVFSPDGKTLVSASADHRVRLWEADTGQLETTLEGHTGRVYSVAFAPDGKTLASSSAEGTVRLWEGGTGQLKTGIIYLTQ